MAHITSKQRVLNQLLTTLKDRYHGGEPEARPVLEQLVYAICREGTTREKADSAFRDLTERFFDWNEVRVSSPHEVQDVFAELPDSESRSHRLLSVLQEVFETTFSFDLESLEKKGLKLATKQLSRYQAASDFAVAWVTQNALGGQVIPVDTPSLRLMRRVGLVEPDIDDFESVRTALDMVVPKARIPVFADAVSGVAEEFCFEHDPDCENCPLNVDCPTAREASGPVAVVARAGRGKPR